MATWLFVVIVAIAALPIAALVGLAMFWPIVERQWLDGTDNIERANVRGRLE